MQRRVVLLGHPVGHSLSAVMQNAAFEALGLALVYEPLDVAPAALAATLAALEDDGAVAGANVTVPHKEAVFRACAVHPGGVDPAAARIGAVNTLTRADGAFRGHNTDAPGLVASLAAAGALPPPDAHAVVLGAGGAARAACAGLLDHGVTTLTVAARRTDQAASLVRDLTPHWPAARLAAAPLTDQSARAADLLVQASTGGMIGARPLAVDPARLVAATPAHCVVADLVYRPTETPLLAAARVAKRRTVAGDGMLLHQGALALGLWTGLAPPLDVMAAALAAALGSQPVQLVRIR